MAAIRRLDRIHISGRVYGAIHREAFKETKGRLSLRLAVGSAAIAEARLLPLTIKMQQRQLFF